jgi:hypothetical protein
LLLLSRIKNRIESFGLVGVTTGICPLGLALRWLPSSLLLLPGLLGLHLLVKQVASHSRLLQVLYYCLLTSFLFLQFLFLLLAITTRLRRRSLILRLLLLFSLLLFLVFARLRARLRPGGCLWLLLRAIVLLDLFRLWLLLLLLLLVGPFLRAPILSLLLTLVHLLSLGFYW